VNSDFDTGEVVTMITCNETLLSVYFLLWCITYGSPFTPQLSKKYNSVSHDNENEEKVSHYYEM